MRCPECAGQLETRLETLHILDEIAGLLVIGNAEYRICRKCGSRSYPAATAARIEEKRRDRIQELVHQLPVSEFVTTRQAASLLGVSKQAFSKNQRIKAGFIYRTTLGDKKIYLKSSVLRFRSVGDGRFPLRQYTPEDVQITTEDDSQDIRCAVGQTPAEVEYAKRVVVVGSMNEWEKPTARLSKSTSLEVVYVR